MFYFKENKFDEMAMKQRYLASLDEQAKKIDPDFYEYAKGHIIIRSHIDIFATVRCNVILRYVFSDKDYYTHTSGYTVEARADSYHVTENTETRSFRYRNSYLYTKNGTYNFEYVNGTLKHTYGSGCDHADTRLLNRSEYSDREFLDELWKRTKYSNQSAFFSEINQILREGTFFQYDSTWDVTKKIEKNHPDACLIKFDSVYHVDTGWQFNDSAYDICFVEVVEIGVSYQGKDYFRKFDNNFTAVIEYSEEAKTEAEEKSMYATTALKKKRNKDILCFTLLLIFCIGSFVLSLMNTGAIERSAQYSEWMSFFIHMPHILTEIVPVLINIICFCILVNGWSWTVYRAETPDFTDNSADSIIADCLLKIRRKRIAFYIFWYLTLFYVLMQMILLLVALI